MVNFEGKEKREVPINECLKTYGIKDLEEAKAIKLEGEKIKKCLSDRDYIITMEIDGKQLTSPEFAEKLNNIQELSNTPIINNLSKFILSSFLLIISMYFLFNKPPKNSDIFDNFSTPLGREMLMTLHADMVERGSADMMGMTVEEYRDYKDMMARIKKGQEEAKEAEHPSYLEQKADQMCEKYVEKVNSHIKEYEKIITESNINVNR